MKPIRRTPSTLAALGAALVLGAAGAEAQRPVRIEAAATWERGGWEYDGWDREAWDAHGWDDDRWDDDRWDDDRGRRYKGGKGRKGRRGRKGFRARGVRVPPGHWPRAGMCRVWYVGHPPGHQPPAVPCRALRGTRPIPGAVLLGAPVRTGRIPRGEVWVRVRLPF